MLRLWEWEAWGLKGTENLVSSLFEGGKNFPERFPEVTGGSSHEASPHFGEDGAFSGKKIITLVC